MIEDEVMKGVGFEPKEHSIIMVLGVGGAGGNAVNHMYDMGIEDVTFMVCNTDKQALRSSPVPIKVQLGEGLGAGNNPLRGRQAALESLNDITTRFEQEHTRMVFITAGMGGGTGTGAAPVIAKSARDRGILTVGIVTMPFSTEGRKRVDQAGEGLKQLKENVDALVVIHNDNISKIYGSLPLDEAFGKADDILATAAKGIAELITRTTDVNVDFADVDTVMRGSGMAIMTVSRAGGEDRIRKAAEAALNSPLLNHQDIRGAKDVLLNISYEDRKATTEEHDYILSYIQEKTSRSAQVTNDTNIIWGSGYKEFLGDDVEITMVVTGFESLDGVRTEETSRKAEPIPASNPFSATFQQPQQIVALKWDPIVHIENVEHYLEVPAYKRRGVKLGESSPAGRSQRITLGENDVRDGREKEEKGSDEGDLFG